MYKSTKKNGYPGSAEKRSVKLLTEKMGLGKKELEQINNQYGVSSSQLLEVMQYNKYQFIFQDETPGQGYPCKSNQGNINPERILH
jgi:hypothetical protein